MQDGGPPPQRHMGELADHPAHHDTLTATPPTQAYSSTTWHVCTARLRGDKPAVDLQAEPVDTAEGSDIRRGKSTAGQVEIFQMGCVGTPIIERPRRLSRDRHDADPSQGPGKVG